MHCPTDRPSDAVPSPPVGAAFEPLHPTPTAAPSSAAPNQSFEFEMQAMTTTSVMVGCHRNGCARALAGDSPRILALFRRALCHSSRSRFRSLRSRVRYWHVNVSGPPAATCVHPVAWHAIFAHVQSWLPPAHTNIDQSTHL